jgi:YHS domain-containing protein
MSFRIELLQPSSSGRASPMSACSATARRLYESAALAPDLTGVMYEPRGRRELRNVREPVELFAAVRAGESAAGSLPRDPVCRTAVDPERAAGRLVYHDTAYFFCSLPCAAEFARHPERWPDPPPATARAGASGEGSTRKIRATRSGSHQFQRPNNRIALGSSSARTTVTSIRIAAARPKPAQREDRRTASDQHPHEARPARPRRAHPVRHPPRADRSLNYSGASGALAGDDLVQRGVGEVRHGRGRVLELWAL